MYNASSNNYQDTTNVMHQIFHTNTTSHGKLAITKECIDPRITGGTGGKRYERLEKEITSTNTYSILLLYVIVTSMDTSSFPDGR